MAKNYCRSLVLILFVAAGLAVAWPAADLFAESKTAVISARTDGPLYYNPHMAKTDEPSGVTLRVGEQYRVLDTRGGMVKVESMRDYRVFWARACDLDV